jgi:peptidoglycan/LPS O-acetylase OafA/YrhL
VLATALTWLSMAAPYLSTTWQMSVPQPPYFVVLFVMGIAAAWFAFGGNSEQRTRTHQKTIWMAAALLLLPLGLLLWQYRIIDGSNVHLFQEHVHLIDPLCGAVAALLLAGLSHLPCSHLVRRILEARVLVWIGGFSYSLYLTHIPILGALNHALDVLIPQKSAHLAFVLMSVIGSVLCLGFAWILGGIFETRRWRTFLSPGKSAKESSQALPLRLSELENEHR